MKRMPRYFLASPTLSEDADAKTMRDYRRYHHGIGYDEVFDMRRALACFLFPRLRTLAREMSSFNDEDARRICGMTARELHLATDILYDIAKAKSCVSRGKRRRVGERLLCRYLAGIFGGNEDGQER